MQDGVTAPVDDRPGQTAAGVGRFDTVMAGIMRHSKRERHAPGARSPTVQSPATHSSLAPPMVKILRLFGDREGDHAVHVAILDAIQAADATAAEARMPAHLEGVRDAVGARARPAAEGAFSDPPEELT